ncbi:MAG: hypothetical protein FJ319_07075 [SAR202 cluster bacterium]|nr:hypothetical protein [SAR202 cluster bacterium]
MTTKLKRRATEGAKPQRGRIIQVPMSPELLLALDALSDAEGTPRAETIREACRFYLRYLERREMERNDRDAYERFPEDNVMAITQEAMLADILPAEEW